MPGKGGDPPHRVAPMTMMAGQLGSYLMTRDASGTSWQPDSTPMRGLDWSGSGWSGMADGYVDGLWDPEDSQTESSKAKVAPIALFSHAIHDSPMGLVRAEGGLQQRR